MRIDRGPLAAAVEVGFKCCEWLKMPFKKENQKGISLGLAFRS